MNIAFVRGAFLNPWEVQTYVPLAQNHSMRLIGSDWKLFKTLPIGFPGPIIETHLWGAMTSVIHPALPVFLNRLRSWTLGESFSLSGLAKATEGCDILHAAETHSTMTWQCLEISRQRGCKVVVTVWENIPHMGETHPRRRQRKREALQTIDGFLAVTETSKQMLIQEGVDPGRIEVIPMAVDLAHFRPMEKDAGLLRQWMVSNEEKVILFIGRWVAEKGIRELEQAIPLIIKQVKTPFRFCFVGEGPEGPRLQKLSDQFPGKITLVPFAPYNQLPAIHNLADIFVLPSKPLPKWEEQFGYVLIESMACRKAVVTTRSGSIPDVVGSAAVLVEPGDPEGLATAISTLLASDRRREELGTAAYTRAVTEFDATRISARIEQFYRRVLSQSL